MDNMRALVDALGPVPNEVTVGVRSAKPLPSSNHPLWAALVKLYHRPWFRRIWIIQEAVLAKGMFVLCGDMILVWSVIEDFAERIMKIWPVFHYQHGEAVDSKEVSGFVSIS